MVTTGSKRRNVIRMTEAIVVDPNYHYTNPMAPLWPVRMLQIAKVQRPIFEVCFYDCDDRERSFECTENEIDDAGLLYRRYRENNAKLPYSKQRISNFLDFVRTKLRGLRDGYQDDSFPPLPGIPKLAATTASKSKLAMEPTRREKQRAKVKARRE